MSFGYQDTPLIPGTNWHVHDGERPQPPVVAPAHTPNGAPSDAIVLFDGHTSTVAEHWQHTQDGSAVQWKVENGAMEVVPWSGHIQTVRHFGDVQLHLEWAAPHFVEGPSQKRGNSGVFMMNKYEIQVLDTWHNPTYPDGTAGALYGQCPPLANACARRGDWNYYDIIWEAPRFDGGSVTKPARVTVLINGVLVHHAKELMGPTQHKKETEYVPHEPTGPIMLQDHKNPVRFRNIWVRELTGYDSGE